MKTVNGYPNGPSNVALLQRDGRVGGVWTNESPPTTGLDPVWAPDKATRPSRSHKTAFILLKD